MFHVKYLRVMCYPIIDGDQSPLLVKIPMASGHPGPPMGIKKQSFCLSTIPLKSTVFD